MKELKIILLLFILISSSGFADTIHLKDGKSITGQLLKITEKVAIIETIKKGKLINISIDRKNISHITDNSKRILYENGKLNVSDLDYFYEKNYLFLNQNKIDTLILSNGSSVVGDIIEISETKLKLRTNYSQSDKSIIRIIPLTQISKINHRPISHAQKNITTAEMANVYPKLAFEFGGSFAFTNLKELKNLINQYIAARSPESGMHIDGIAGTFGLVQLSFIFKFSQIIGLGATSHINFTPERNAFRVMFSEFKYYFPWNGYSPWIGAGYAYQSIRIEDSVYGEADKYSWECKSSGPSFAIGIEIANETGAGFYTNLRYLSFPTKKTLDNEIDLSVILISAGLILNY